MARTASTARTSSFGFRSYLNLTGGATDKFSTPHHTKFNIGPNIEFIAKVRHGADGAISETLGCKWEGTAYSPLTSVTSVGTTATVTYAGHGQVTGEWVNMSGCSPSAYNGAYQITRHDANTFDYVFAGGTSPATGASKKAVSARRSYRFVMISGAGDPTGFYRHQTVGTSTYGGDTGYVSGTGLHNGSYDDTQFPIIGTDEDVWYRYVVTADNGAGNAQTDFYNSRDKVENPEDVRWVYQSTALDVKFTNISFDTRTTYNFGRSDGQTPQVFTGRIYYTRLKDLTANKVVSETRFITAPTGAVSFIDDNNNLFTATGSAAIATGSVTTADLRRKNTITRTASSVRTKA